MGFDLAPSKILQFFMDNVRKKFRHWSNKLLMMAGCLVLIRHVIRSIPIYYLIFLNLAATITSNWRQFVMSFSGALVSKVIPASP